MDKTVVIVTGASRGLGAAVTCWLATTDATVLIGDGLSEPDVGGSIDAGDCRYRRPVFRESRR